MMQTRIEDVCVTCGRVVDAKFRKFCTTCPPPPRPAAMVETLRKVRERSGR